MLIYIPMDQSMSNWEGHPFPTPRPDLGAFFSKEEAASLCRDSCGPVVAEVKGEWWVPTHYNQDADGMQYTQVPVPGLPAYPSREQAARLCALGCSPQRINFFSSDAEDENPNDPNDRPCQCGSGEPWVSCGAASEYCG